MGVPWGGNTSAEKYEMIINQLEHRIIPAQYPEPNNDASLGTNELGIESRIYRDLIVLNSGHAFLAEEWVQPLAKWIGNRPCLEIMAGSGALSCVLARNGVNIIATDDGSWATQYSSWFSNPWTNVEKLNCVDAIAKYASECAIIICSWPYMDDNAYLALLEMRKVNPSAVMIYIGEEHNGVTASDLFFNTLIQVEDEEFVAAIKSYKSSYDLNDHPYLLK